MLGGARCAEFYGSLTAALFYKQRPEETAGDPTPSVWWSGGASQLTLWGTRVTARGRQCPEFRALLARVRASPPSSPTAALLAHWRWWARGFTEGFLGESAIGSASLSPPCDVRAGMRNIPGAGPSSSCRGRARSHRPPREGASAQVHCGWSRGGSGSCPGSEGLASVLRGPSGSACVPSRHGRIELAVAGGFWGFPGGRGGPPHLTGQGLRDCQFGKKGWAPCAALSASPLGEPSSTQRSRAAVGTSS